MGPVPVVFGGKPIYALGWSFGTADFLHRSFVSHYYDLVMALPALLLCGYQQNFF